MSRSLSKPLSRVFYFITIILFLWTTALFLCIWWFINPFLLSNQLQHTVDISTNSKDNENNNYYVNSNNFEFINLTEPIAILMTACAKTEKRWNILCAAIDSIEKYNTYAYTVRKIVMYDCDDDIGFNRVKDKYASLNYEFYKTSSQNNNNRTISGYGNPKQFRIASSIIEGINLLNDTKIKMIFKTEDDWIFYRYNFIQISLLIYQHNIYLNQNNLLQDKQYSKISFISLRNRQFHQPFKHAVHFCGGAPWDAPEIENKIYNTINGNISYSLAVGGYCKTHFSFQPSLIDKQLTKEYLSICVKKFINSTNPHLKKRVKMEYCSGCQYKSNGYINAYIMDNGYYGHGGVIDHGYHHQDLLSYTTIPNISIITQSKDILDSGWMLNLNNCTYEKI